MSKKLTTQVLKVLQVAESELSAGTLNILARYKDFNDVEATRPEYMVGIMGLEDAISHAKRVEDNPDLYYKDAVEELKLIQKITNKKNCSYIHLLKY